MSRCFESFYLYSLCYMIYNGSIENNKYYLKFRIILEYLVEVYIVLSKTIRCRIFF